MKIITKAYPRYQLVGITGGGEDNCPPPPGSILTLKKCTFSYDTVNVKNFFGKKIQDFKILAPLESFAPLGNFLATPLGLVELVCIKSVSWPLHYSGISNTLGQKINAKVVNYYDLVCCASFFAECMSDIYRRS